MMTQCEQIYYYMKEHGEISQRDAYKLGCTRLAARISDLKRRGVDISVETRKVKTMTGEARVAFYRIRGTA